MKKISKADLAQLMEDLQTRGMTSKEVEESFAKLKELGIIEETEEGVEFSDSEEVVEKTAVFFQTARGIVHEALILFGEVGAVFVQNIKDSDPPPRKQDLWTTGIVFFTALEEAARQGKEGEMKRLDAFQTGYSEKLEATARMMTKDVFQQARIRTAVEEASKTVPKDTN